MTDNCEECGKFVPDYEWRDIVVNPYLCRKCNNMIFGESCEAETGIGTGQFVDSGNDDYCRHLIRKWPMSETVFNAVYGIRNEIL